MRKSFLLLLIAFSLSSQIAHSQLNLYGISTQGGEGSGTIFKFQNASKTLTSDYNFPKTGDDPCYLMKMAITDDGQLFGFAKGGTNGLGTIFSFDPTTKIYKTRYSFSVQTGSRPTASLVLHPNGKLYGKTDQGGSTNAGILFSFDPFTDEFVKLYDFAASENYLNIGPAFVISDGGLLVGLSHGAAGKGGLYSFDPVSKKYTALSEFTDQSGFNPVGALLKGTDGFIYGVTASGAALNNGSIYKFDQHLNSITALFSLTSLDFYKWQYFGGLMQAKDGNLYGTASLSDFVNSVFRLDLHTVPNTFSRWPIQGAFQTGTPVQGKDSSLFISAVNNVYTFDLSTHVQGFLNGANFHGGGLFTMLSVDKDGVLYGTAQHSFDVPGSSQGLIFSYNNNSLQFSEIHHFYDTRGNLWGLTQFTPSNFYGTTSLGAAKNSGFAFEFDSRLHGLRTLFTSPGASSAGEYGTGPNGGLTKLGDSLLIGTTETGGINYAFGTIYTIDKSGRYNHLLDMSPYNTSTPYRPQTNNPVGTLEQAPDGKFYGVTSRGGVNDSGTIYSYDPSDVTINRFLSLADFDKISLKYAGGLVSIGSSILYGVTYTGGSLDNGTIFKFDYATRQLQTVYSFNGSAGQHPVGKLLKASNGELYGLTQSGGLFQKGTLYKINPTSGLFTKLIDLSDEKGSAPLGSLMQASDGKIYGYTNTGGLNNLGVVFSFDPITNTYTKEQDFDGANGANPVYGALTEELPSKNISPIVSLSITPQKTNFQAGEMITVQASARDLDGRITRVEFYNFGSKVFEDSTYPYTIATNEVEPGNYKVTARAIDDSGAITISDTLSLTIAGCEPTGVILGEGFTNITGNQVADLTSNVAFPKNPSILAEVSSFEYSSVGDNYGGWLRGYICAPQTGNYSFYIAADDQAGLFLSTNDDPANKVLIAYSLSPSGYRNWLKSSTQKSLPVRLLKGQRYYVETLHKQAIGENYLSVGWVLPDGTGEGPIPGNRLTPYDTITAPKSTKSFQQAMNELVSSSNTEAKLAISPNPSTNEFVLQLSRSADAYNLIVFDVAGRIVEKHSNLQGGQTFRFGHGLKAGTYFVETDANGKKERSKIVKL